jgi:O-antigen/teichoic acid export membrane protein
MSTPEQQPLTAALRALRRPGGLRELAAGDTGRAFGMAVAVMAGNVIALAYTVAFARLLGGDGYGTLAALVAAFLVLAVPGQALQATVARDVGAAAAAGHPEPGAGARRWLRGLLLATVLVALASALAREWVAALVSVSEDDVPWAAAAVLPTGCLWLVLCVERGALQGLARYRLVGVSIVCEQIGRLVAGVALILVGGDVTGAYFGLTLTIAATSLFLAVPLMHELGPHRADAPSAGRRLRDLLRRAWAPLLALALIGVLQNVDVILVKARVDEPDDAAGSWAVAAVAGKSIVWVAIGMGLYLLPEAARRTQLGEDARPVLARTLGLAALLGVPMVALFAVAGEPILAAVFGDDLTLASDALPIIGAAMTFLACTYLAVQYLLALHHWRFIGLLAVGAAAEVALLLTVGDSLTTLALALLALQAALAAVVVAGAMRTAHRAA